jgi:prolyl-tRNA synthetase
MYGKWIESYRDLPLLINQWANVVRWEMRTRPFLRTAEFLWQEGHTAHASRQEAIDEAEQMLRVYAAFAREFCAIPVIEGIKSANERFAGAEETYTIEAMMQNGWALQAGTSHFLGQNFAKAFDVKFQTVEGQHDYVWATSWGVSTRMVGAVIMTHSDDTGLVLPPRMAPTQVVVVPIWKTDDEKPGVVNAGRDLVKRLKAAGVRAHLDDRDTLKPGAKYYEWERKGVPFRMEIGPRDLDKGQAFCARRIGGGKFSVSLENAPTEVPVILDAIQDELFARALAAREAGTHTVDSYEAFKARIDQGGFFLVPWHADPANEEQVKDDTRATIRCYPLDRQAEAEGKTCFFSGRPATHMAIFARAY